MLKLGNHHVFQSGHLAEKPYILKRAGQTHLANFVRVCAKNTAIAQQNSTPLSPVKAAKTIEESRFPGAIRADNADNLALAYGDIDLIHGAKSAKGFAQVFDF